MNAAAPTAATACAKCAAPNPAGAAFCANCGAPFTASPPPMPPPVIPRAPMPAGGSQAQATLAMDAQQAFATAVNAVAAAGGQMVGQQPPMAIQFNASKKSFWGTMNIPCRYRGEVTLAPAGPRQTAARVSVKIDWSGSSGFIALNLVVLLFTGFLIIPLAIVGFSLWSVSSKWSRDIAEAVAAQMPAMGAAPAWSPQPQAYTPTPQPPRPPVTPPAPPKAAAGPAAAPSETEVVDRLRKLKELLDQGVLDQAEYDAKRAELVAKL